MRYLELYDETKIYMYPNGELASPERVRMDYPAITVFPHIIETDESGQVFAAIDNLSAARSRHNIDSLLSDDAAIEAIQDILNTPPPEPEPSSEERIAAALELQNLMMMEDIVI